MHSKYSNKTKPVSTAMHRKILVIEGMCVRINSFEGVLL